MVCFAVAGMILTRLGRPFCKLVVVPFGHRASILTKYRDECGHMGEEKTLLRLHSRFHWYGMRCDVVDWVGSYSSCSAHKTPKRRGRGAPLVSTWCGYPWERVAMDLIPNLPVTKHGNRHLLVVMDYFTKWAEAFPLPDMRAETIASVFLGDSDCGTLWCPMLRAHRSRPESGR